MEPDCHQFLVPPLPHPLQHEDHQFMHRLTMMASGGADQHYDPAGGTGTKGGGERKRRFTEEQVRSLETTFHARRAKLEPREKAELARELGLQPRQVAIWFQNKRARWRSKQLEHDYADLRARYDALRERVDALKREKLALAAQVDELRGRLDLNERQDQSGSCGVAASGQLDDKRNTNTNSSVVSSRDDAAAAAVAPAAPTVTTSSEEDSTAAGYYDDDHVAYLPDPFCNPPELWEAWPLLEWNAVA